MVPNIIEILRSAAMLVGGAAFAQLLNLAGTLAVAQIYGLQEYGIYAIFIAFQTLAVSVATLRFELAMVVEQSEAAVYDLYGLSTYILTAASLILAAWVYLPLPSGISPSSFSSDSFLLLPFSVFFAGQYVLLGQWCVRAGMFNQFAIAATSLAAVTVAVQVLGGLLAPTAPTLMFGYTVGQIAGIAVLWLGLRKDVSFQSVLASLTRFGSFWPLVRRHYRFAVYQMPNSLAGAAYVGAPAIILGSAISPQAAGSFSFAIRMIFQPLALLPTAFGQVVFSKMARSLDRLREWERPLAKVYLGFGLLFALPCSIVMCFGEDLAVFFLGEQWRLAGKMAEVMVLPCVMMALVAGYDRIYDNIGAQRVAFILSFCSAGLMVAGVLFTVSYLRDVELFYWFFSLLHLAYAYAWMFFAMMLCGFSVSRASGRWLAVVLLVLLVAATITAVTALGGSALFAIAAGVLVYAVSVLMVRSFLMTRLQ
ncbi:oligosaccharide flippase family protein [Hyphomicrobium sulfonivorans]|uniref:oligosaccharide flippase family protein n=2 Tax=Hyphomicrobium sulfonivorans TaxID=121290 RepID=UPI0018E14BD2|nr:oligosaccharide flippase family protein [Hyphomicrobium sulfonivorans]